MKPIIYYHIFATESGTRIACDQLIKMRQFCANAEIRCGIVSPSGHISNDLNMIIQRSQPCSVIDIRQTGNEWLTLRHLHHAVLRELHAQQPVLYCHTKGAQSESRYGAVVRLWREWMEYLLIFRWQDAIDILHKGYSTYGFDAWFNPRRTLWQRLRLRSNFFIYSGNYWWSTAGSLARIRLEGVDMSVRHTAESEFVRRIPRIRPFDALWLIGLPSIKGGVYTNYCDSFKHFPALANKEYLLDQMRERLNCLNIDQQPEPVS